MVKCQSRTVSHMNPPVIVPLATPFTSCSVGEHPQRPTDAPKARSSTTAAIREPTSPSVLQRASIGFRWLYIAVLLLNIPEYILSTRSPCLRRYTGDGWESCMRTSRFVLRSSACLSAVLLSLGAALIQAPLLPAVPAAAMFVDLANLLALAGVVYSLMLQFRLSRLDSCNDNGLQRVAFSEQSLVTVACLLSTPPALTAWSAACFVMGMGLSKLGPLLPHAEVQSPQVSKSAAPLVSYTIMVTCLFAHGAYFLRAIRRFDERKVD